MNTGKLTRLTFGGELPSAVGGELPSAVAWRVRSRHSMIVALAVATLLSPGFTGLAYAGSTSPIIAYGGPLGGDTNFGISAVSTDGQIVVGQSAIFDRANKLVTFENHDGIESRVSADGRYVVFTAGDDASLDPTDTNGHNDIYQLDRQSGAISRISVGAGRVQGNNDSNSPRISSDDRYIVFLSYASDLTSDSVSGTNVLAWDRTTGSLFRLGLGPNSGSSTANLTFHGSGGKALFFTDNKTLNVATLSTRTSAPLVLPTTDGKVPNGVFSGGLAISGDGNTIVFNSTSSNFVANDHNPTDGSGKSDLFIYHVQTKEVTRIVTSTGTDPNGNTDNNFCVSDDGRYIAFASNASNLVPYDTNGTYDIFLFDQQAATLTRISTANDGTESPNSHTLPSSQAMTGDGRYVFYQSNYSLITGIQGDFVNVVYDRLGTVHSNPTPFTGPPSPTEIAGKAQAPAGTITQIPVGDPQAGFSGLFQSSSNGRFLLYGEDIYGGGNYFYDTHLYLANLQTGETTDVLPAAATTTNSFFFRYAAVSDDGRYVFFSCTDGVLPNDANGFEDIFVFDTQLGTYTKITHAGNGTQTNGDSRYFVITPDGAYVAFASDAKDLILNDTNNTTDVFVYTVATGVTELVSVSTAGVQGNAYSDTPAISDDGRYVAFRTHATNLAPGNTTGNLDICLRDRTAKTTTRVNLRADGIQFNADCNGPIALNSTGQYIAFTSQATNVRDTDVYNFNKVYWRNLSTKETREITHAPDGSPANADSSPSHLSITADGNYVAFTSTALNLTPYQTNGNDCYLYSVKDDSNSCLTIAANGTDVGGDGAIISEDGRYVVFIAGGHTALGTGNDTAYDFALFVLDRDTPAQIHPPFFTGEVALDNGVYYLSFPNAHYFGYYSYLTNQNYIYHFDLGYEYLFDAADGRSGIYFYDFKSKGYFYTSPTFPFPYLYDFTLKSVVYYYPDPKNAGHYNTNGVRYFYVFSTGKIISK